MKTSFRYEQGDIKLLVLLLSVDANLLSENVKRLLNDNGVDLVEIIIERESGNDTTSQGLLHRISANIAEFLMDNPNVILYYSCDDINPIPNRNTKGANRDIPVQEYRDRIFTHLYNSYVNRYHLMGYVNKSIRIDGEGYSEYLHLVAGEHLSDIAQQVKEYILEGWGKPDSPSE